MVSSLSAQSLHVLIIIIIIIIIIVIIIIITIIIDFMLVFFYQYLHRSHQLKTFFSIFAYDSSHVIWKSQSFPWYLLSSVSSLCFFYFSKDPNYDFLTVTFMINSSLAKYCYLSSFSFSFNILKPYDRTVKFCFWRVLFRRKL